MTLSKSLSLLVLAACVAASGCGADEEGQARNATASDAAVAQRIERSAKQRQDAAGRAAQAPAAQPLRALISAADRASFERLARRLPGNEGVAVAAIGVGQRVSVAGSLRTGAAWSTAKVPVAMAAIAAGVGTRRDVLAAITASDNTAADRLWTALGGSGRAAAATTRQLRAAGDSETLIQARRLRSPFTAFGQTSWSLAAQARFVAGMRCSEPGLQILALMNRVVAAQRWGLGTVGTNSQFKGGWGPGISPGKADGWLDRQMGLILIRGVPLSVAIATTADNHATGTRNLSLIARWVATHVDVRAAPRRASCRGIAR